MVDYVFFEGFGGGFGCGSYTISSGGLCGASSSVTATTTLYEEEIIPSTMPISLTVGTKLTEIIHTSGSRGLITVYANYESNNPILSSAGACVHAFDYTMDASFALDDLGIYFSHTNGSTTDSLGFRITPTKGIIGVYISNSVTSGNFTTENYTYFGINGYYLAAAYCLANGYGLPVVEWAPQPVYSR